MMSNPQGEIFLTSKQIMDAGCIDCSLLVAVMSLDPEGTDVEFEVQFVQTVEELDERRVAIGDIDKNSYVYYSYRATADNQSVLFVLSDHNQQCGVLYLSQLEYPNSKQFLLQSATNELVLSPT